MAAASPKAGAAATSSSASTVCVVCGSACTKSCASCHSVYYCSREHQKAHWKQHKRQCGLQSSSRSNPSASSSSSQFPPTAQPAERLFPPSSPPPDAWQNGLSEAQQYEWIIDCYRMRLDDDYVWGGGHAHGIYTGGDKLSVVCDFLEFVLLASRRGALSLASQAQWAALLATAARLLPYGFEKKDAQEKWDGESVLSSVVTGRSLRYTGEVVYGSGIMAGSRQDPVHAEVQKKVAALMDEDGDVDDEDGDMEDEEEEGDLDDDDDRDGEGDDRDDGGGDEDDVATPAFEANRALFDPVGGVDVWADFYKQLRLIR